MKCVIIDRIKAFVLIECADFVRFSCDLHEIMESQGSSKYIVNSTVIIKYIVIEQQAMETN